MCHIEDESSWTINVKLSLVLAHLPIWHATGRPKWSFKYLRETTSKACPQWAFIHLSFFPISLVPFCQSPDNGTGFFGSGYQLETTWSPLFCTIPVHDSPHSRSLHGRKVLRRPHEEQGCSWGSEWDPAKRHGFPLQQREVIFQADQGSSGAQRNLNYKFIQHRHITSVVWNKSNMSHALLSKIQCLVESWRQEVWLNLLNDNRSILQ